MEEGEHYAEFRADRLQKSQESSIIAMFVNHEDATIELKQTQKMNAQRWLADGRKLHSTTSNRFWNNYVHRSLFNNE